MTLVPAVLVLLGRHAWWLPAWLDRRIPAVDVEGAAMHRRIDYQDWEATNGTAALVARDLRSRRQPAGAHLEAPADAGTDHRARPVPRTWTPTELAMVLVGRGRAEQRRAGRRPGCCSRSRVSAVHSRAAFVDVDEPAFADDRHSVDVQVAERARMTTSSRKRRAAFVAHRPEALIERYDAAVGHAGRGRSSADARAAVVETGLAVAGGGNLVVLTEEQPDSTVRQGTAGALADALSEDGITRRLLRQRNDLGMPARSDGTGREPVAWQDEQAPDAREGALS